MVSQNSRHSDLPGMLILYSGGGLRISKPQICWKNQEDIDVAVANVLDIAASIDPTKIHAKIKYHLLTHIREDVQRFGPLIGVATETHEAFNAIFRFCSILSNHHAPSRDIAYQEASLEEMKHRLTGGWWFNSEASEWVQAGPSVRHYITSNQFLATLYGWATRDEHQSGMVNFSHKCNLLDNSM